MTFAAALVVVAAIGRVLAGGAVPDVVRGSAAAGGGRGARDRTSPRPPGPPRRARRAAGRSSALRDPGPRARARRRRDGRAHAEGGRGPARSNRSRPPSSGTDPWSSRDRTSRRIVIATEPETRDLDVGLADELVEAGAAVLLVVEEGGGPDRRRLHRARHARSGPGARGLDRARAAARLEARGPAGSSAGLVPARDQGDDA